MKGCWHETSGRNEHAGQPDMRRRNLNRNIRNVFCMGNDAMTLRKILEEYERIVEIRHHCRIRIQMFGHQGEFKESKAMIVKCNEIIAEAREAIVSGDGRHIANMIFKMDEIE